MRAVGGVAVGVGAALGRKGVRAYKDIARGVFMKRTLYG